MMATILISPVFLTYLRHLTTALHSTYSIYPTFTTHTHTHTRKLHEFLARLLITVLPSFRSEQAGVRHQCGQSLRLTPSCQTERDPRAGM